MNFWPALERWFSKGVCFLRLHREDAAGRWSHRQALTSLTIGLSIASFIHAIALHSVFGDKAPMPLEFVGIVCYALGMALVFAIFVFFAWLLSRLLVNHPPTAREIAILSAYTYSAIFPIAALALVSPLSYAAVAFDRLRDPSWPYVRRAVLDSLTAPDATLYARVVAWGGVGLLLLALVGYLILGLARAISESPRPTRALSRSNWLRSGIAIGVAYVLTTLVIRFATGRVYWLAIGALIGPAK